MAPRKETIRQMFNEISPRYDFLNHFLSFGIDHWWRRNLIRLLGKKHPLRILDVATGTGDLAVALSGLNPEKITGIDIAEKMIGIATEKIRQKGLDNMISFAVGDAEKIPFSDNSFDAVTVAFGVRNYEDLEKGLSEMRRVMRKGGSMFILEFSQPASSFVKGLYRFYSKSIIPVTGKLVSGSNSAYTYLPESVATFPSGGDFLEIMHKAGLKDLEKYPMTFGIATIYTGTK